MFTAVDGTLLDFDTFDDTASRPVALQLAAEGIPLVPITAMTLEEMEPIARAMGMRHAMIVEAGGAIARWNNGSWEIEACGTEADALLDAVSAIEARSGADLVVYSVLPEKDAARLSGRSGAMLRGSTRRCFSEPFLIERGDIAEVEKAAALLGFNVKRGRRFFYLTRAGAEAEAFLRLRDELRCDVAIALGGSPLDAEFLLRCELPVIVPRPDGIPDPELVAAVPAAHVAALPGAAGWAGAVSHARRSVVRKPPRAAARA